MDSSKNSFSGAGFDEHHEHGGSHPDENECTTFSYQEWFRFFNKFFISFLVC
jgi:hypothetical protein